MKKKKSFVALALVVAVLVLGVGYALTTIELKVNGDITVSPDDSNFDVNFTDASITTAGTLTGKTDVADKGNGKTATLSVKTLKTVGEKVIAEYTITNNSKAGINATLTNPVATQTNDDAKDYYTVTAELADTNSIAPNGTKKLTVTVELVKAPLDEVTGNFTVTFNASATK
ncbi:MAG: hypothetical protein KIC90_03035 [Firmicutes bacterium]|nr:hypothetical protein [Bacillota bacterium]